MATLLNTTWKITADNHDFMTFTVNFQPIGIAIVTFSNGVQAIQSSWSEGKHFHSFTLNFTYPGQAEEQYNLVGTHQDGTGSGLAIIDWTGGAQKSPFHMVKSS